MARLGIKCVCVGLEIGEPEDYPYNPHDAVYTVAKLKEIETRGVSSVKTDDLMHWTEVTWRTHLSIKSLMVWM